MHREIIEVEKRVRMGGEIMKFGKGDKKKKINK